MQVTIGRSEKWASQKEPKSVFRWFNSALGHHSHLVLRLAFGLAFFHFRGRYTGSPRVGIANLKFGMTSTRQEITHDHDAKMS